MLKNKLIKALKEEVNNYQLEKCLKAIFGENSEKTDKQDYSKIKGFWSDKNDEK